MLCEKGNELKTFYFKRIDDLIITDYPNHFSKDNPILKREMESYLRSPERLYAKEAFTFRCSGEGVVLPNDFIIRLSKILNSLFVSDSFCHLLGDDSSGYDGGNDSTLENWDWSLGPPSSSGTVDEVLLFQGNHVDSSLRFWIKEEDLASLDFSKIRLTHVSY